MDKLRFALFVFVVGCTSSSSPGGMGEWIPSDIDPHEMLDRLGTAAYGKLCDAFSDYVHDMYRSNLLIKAACTAHALQTTSDAVTCGDEANACLDTLPPVVDQQLETILAQASCPALAIDPTLCSAPVSAVTACLDALGTKINEIELSATCAAFGSQVPSDWWMIQEPAECAALRQGC